MVERPYLFKEKRKMLKLTFNEPTTFYQHGLKQNCRFLYCMFLEFEKVINVKIHSGIDDWSIISVSEIKSIEHVNPTDL